MRVYLTPPQPSRGLQRIADALVRYKPEWVEVVDKFAEADLVVLYAIGRRERLQTLTTAMVEDGVQKYAIIQVCLRSTMSPRTEDWHEIWFRAQAVWSYYDLERAIDEDGGHPAILPNFYHAPLGADAEVFRMRGPKFCLARRYTVMTSGASRLSESVRECWLAVEQVGGIAHHLGQLRTPLHVWTRVNVNDSQLADYYNETEFVSGLRRKEGFELPAIEGLLCGARPIVFDTPDYRWNYGNHAVYIQEGTRQEVVDSLVQIFRHGAVPVSEEERQRAVERYNWETIVKGFYDRICNS